MTSPQSGNALMKRLWQRTERPGCVRHGQGQAILARHTRMAARPSLAELLLRRGHSAEYAAQDAPVIVAARPADVWPEMTARPDAAAMAAPPPTAVPAPAPAPRPTVQARLARPSDIASASPVPVRPGPSAETSSPAAVLRDTESTESTEVAGRRRTASARVEVAWTDAAPPGWEGAPHVPAAPSADPVATSQAPGEATATTRSAPPSSPPTTAITTAEGTRSVPRRPPATVTVTVPSRIMGQSGHYFANTAHDQEKGLAEGSQVPVVRERDFYHNGIGQSASSIAQRPARLPASIATAHIDRSAPVPPVSGPQDLSKAIAALMAPGPPSTGRSAPPARQRDPAGRDTDPPGHRADAASRRADAASRYDDPASRERDRPRPAAPQVDIDRIVGTVQRRLAHHMTIERERRGMR